MFSPFKPLSVKLMLAGFGVDGAAGADGPLVLREASCTRRR